MYLHAGGEPGTCATRIRTWLKKEEEDENTTDQDLLNKAKLACRNEYLAILFVKHSDPVRFGSLNKEIADAHATGSDQYPKTIAAAVDLLITYQDPYARRQQ